MHAPQPLPVPSLRLAQSFPPYYTVTLAPRPKLPAILYRHSFHLEVPILGPTLFGLKGATAYDQLGQLRTPMTPDEQRGQGVPMRGGSARPLCLLGTTRDAPGGCGQLGTPKVVRPSHCGRPATASGARASRLQRRRFHCVRPFRTSSRTSGSVSRARPRARPRASAASSPTSAPRATRSSSSSAKTSSPSSRRA